LWAAHFVPETRDKTLEEMDKLFEDVADLAKIDERKKDIRKTLANRYAPEPFIGPGGTSSSGFRTPVYD
jgi:signal transduction histidine kinase